MKELQPQEIRAYLERVLAQPVRILGTDILGEGGDFKGFGYGTPVRIRFEVAGRPRSAVLETMRAGPFGHEHMADRAAVHLASHATYARLPRHVRSLDVGAFDRDGRMHSLGHAEEFFLLMDYVEGRPYFEDLRNSGPLDAERADALCDYLVEIHKTRGADPGLYVRRIRELLGHGECIMGLADSYPAGFERLLERIELLCLNWRWKIKSRSHRLRQVHGDFHPWNVLFREGTDFTVLDRSRGEWGEAADDVTSMTINYLFFWLQGGAHLETLFRRFWDRYLERSGDGEILEVAAPFFAFRGLVLASPLWYPKLPEAVRRRLFTFVENVLEVPRFLPERMKEYCGCSPSG